MISTSDLYWLSGLLEGEGCFRYVANSGYVYPKVILKMTDLDVVEKAAGFLGSKIHKDYLKPTENHKQAYVTTLTGAKAAGWMMTLYSLMGDRRRSKIYQILSKWKEDRGGRPASLLNVCLRGHQYTSDNTYMDPNGYRSCKECRRTSARNYQRRIKDRKVTS